MKKLLVTGASGFLGWNICNLAGKEWDVCGTVFSHPVEIAGANILKVDLTDYGEMKKVFNEIRPDAVIHTAAAADPNYCQSNRAETRRTNVDASVNIAGLCSDAGTPFVFTSTDLVFDGLNAPYREDDPVSPINIYGEQKVTAEREILKRYPDAAVCRMALMFGLSGPSSESFIQPMLRAMREGRELRLFVDEIRTPISAATAVWGLLIALQKAKGLLHLGGSERISRYDFGRLMANVFGVPDAKLVQCRQKDMTMAAPRAPDVSFDNSKASALGFSPLPLRDELTAIIHRLSYRG
ncbi:MAG: NAD(P)-dependent oxidoreductase [Nitrospiraceae bacterium]|nr:MAG: NAD(P)-dependent oxidoreductase [Nitrospiraceae bacterium]